MESGAVNEKFNVMLPANQYIIEYERPRETKIELLMN